MTGARECQPEAAALRRINGEFYAKDGIVHRAPVHTKTETGTNISVGFPVCEPSDYVDAEQLAGCLNEHEALKSRVEELTKALEKINEIRNSIIGTHSLNWSEHVYPLVAALGEAGLEGMSYPEARANYGTLVERAVKAEDALKEISELGDVRADEASMIARRALAMSLEQEKTP